MNNQRIVISICFMILRNNLFGFSEIVYQDQTSPHPNTLSDDVDDIQKQLEKEALDKVKYNPQKAVWIFNLPPRFPSVTCIDSSRHKRKHHSRFNFRDYYMRKPFQSEAVKDKQGPPEWSYTNQHEWHKDYPDCGGRSQSPVSLSSSGHVKCHGARKLTFTHFATAANITLENDGRRLTLRGDWPTESRPVIQGGAVHTRQYAFDSLSFHWPSEHMIGDLQYPIESQALFISTMYNSTEDAIAHKKKDQQSFVGVASLYKFDKTSDAGIETVLKASKMRTDFNTRCVKLGSLSLKHFCPEFAEYACYHGSLTTPPCTEAVLWFIRAKALNVNRDLARKAQQLVFNGHRMYVTFRMALPLNDRRVFYFK